ncbi:hypothetical protein ACIU1J_10775 [Azospirillum doebereinerae]|uniref:hypothetical protein n=1 Tax=Azospirillum doebereinerae TaxID=92933 RepID=UPI00384D08EF
MSITTRSAPIRWTAAIPFSSAVPKLSGSRLRMASTVPVCQTTSAVCCWLTASSRGATMPGAISPGRLSTRTSTWRPGSRAFNSLASRTG